MSTNYPTLSGMELISLRDGVCSIVRSTLTPHYTQSMDFTCEYWSRVVVGVAYSMSRHCRSDYDLGQVRFVHGSHVSKSELIYRISLELNFAIIASCIPTLRPLFHYFNKSFRTAGRGNGRHGVSDKPYPDQPNSTSSKTLYSIFRLYEHSFLASKAVTSKTMSASFFKHDDSNEALTLEPQQVGQSRPLPQRTTSNGAEPYFDQYTCAHEEGGGQAALSFGEQHAETRPSIR